MHLIYWLLLGLVAGYIGSKIVNKSGEGILMDTLIGICGSVLGGWLAATFLHMGAGGLIYNLIVAVIGSVILLLVYRAIRSAV
jgi:uncharacterized membrane protein YeaQ/YmgE (transglycosylase-associated protein family)